MWTCGSISAVLRLRLRAAHLKTGYIAELDSCSLSGVEGEHRQMYSHTDTHTENYIVDTYWT